MPPGAAASPEEPAVPAESLAVSGAPFVQPRVVPKGTSDSELLEATDWQLVGFPALSRDGMHVAAIFSPASRVFGVGHEGNPNVDGPGDIVLVEYPDMFFVVIDATTGAVERKDILVGADEFQATSKQKSKRALAARVRQRLAAADRALRTDGYRSMPSVRFGRDSPKERASVEVDAMKVHITAEHLSLTDASNRSRLEVELRGWSGAPLPLNAEFTCLYTPRIEQVAIDEARRIAVFVVAQDVNGGDACWYSPNLDSSLRLLRLAP